MQLLHDWLPVSLVDGVCVVPLGKVHSGLVHASRSVIGLSQGIHDGRYLRGAEPCLLMGIPERLHIHLPPRPNQLRLSRKVGNDDRCATRLSLNHSQAETFTHRARQQNISCRIHRSQSLLRETNPICVLVNNLVLMFFQPCCLQLVQDVYTTRRTITLDMQIDDRIRMSLGKDGKRQQILGKRFA